MGEGFYGAKRCTIVLEDGTRRAAIVKRGPIDQISAEIFCAVLLRGWGLNVPDPFLVKEESGLAFASADAGYPSLSRRLSLDHLPDGSAKSAAMLIAARIAVSMKSAGLAAAADEAIDNRDRNLGNILWDGTQEAWIDHGLALGNGAKYDDINKLCVMAVNLCGDYANLQRAAVANSMTLSASHATTAQEAITASGIAFEAEEFVTRRLPGLAKQVLARFPQPADLLSGA